MTSASYDLVVVGAGITGLAAARDAARSGAKVACVEALMFGGLVTNVNELDPAPAGVHGSGIDLASELMTEINELGVEYVSTTVLGIDGGDEGTNNGTNNGTHKGTNKGTDNGSNNGIDVRTSDGKLSCKAVIVASGASLRKLGVPGEAEFEHRGISNCADCDAPLYQGQDVAVVGGGDSALQEALVLAGYCRTVLLIHRGETLAASRKLIDAVQAAPNIRLRPRTVVEEIRGTEGVESLVLRTAGSDHTDTVASTGLFVYVGLQPNSAFLPDELDRDTDGFLLVDVSCATSIPGIFAAGAVRAGFGGLLEHAFDDAGVAATSALSRVKK